MRGAGRIRPLKLEGPKPMEVRPGGLIDAARKGLMIEYLADMWPENSKIEGEMEQANLNGYYDENNLSDRENYHLAH